MKAIAAWVYGLHCILVVPWFLGAFYRHEMSSSPWTEFLKQVELHGISDASFGLYLYAVFYSLPMVLAWNYLPQYIRRNFRILCVAWFGYTVFLLLPVLLQIAHKGWPVAVWVAISALVFEIAAPHIKKARRASDNDT